MSCVALTSSSLLHSCREWIPRGDSRRQTNVKSLALVPCRDFCGSIAVVFVIASSAFSFIMFGRGSGFPQNDRESRAIVAPAIVLSVSSARAINSYGRSSANKHNGIRALEINPKLKSRGLSKLVTSSASVKDVALSFPRRTVVPEIPDRIRLDQLLNGTVLLPSVMSDGAAERKKFSFRLMVRSNNIRILIYFVTLGIIQYTFELDVKNS